MIEQPTLSNYVRTGVNGSVDVVVVDQSLTVEVYGVAVAGGATSAVFLAGSRIGSGSVTLNLSAASTIDFANGVLPICQIFPVAKDALGNYGPPGLFATPPLFDFVTTPATMTMGTRSLDGTSVDVTVTGMAANDAILVFWTTVAGDLALQSISHNGVTTISGLNANTNYIFICFHLITTFQCLIPIVLRSDRLPYTADPLPTAFLRRMLKQDAVYWAYLGSDEFGQAVLADPIQIKCRWIDQESMFTGADGSQLLSVAKIYPDRMLTLEGFLMKGTLLDLDSDQEPAYGISAFPIRAVEEHPDLKAKRSNLIIYLQKKIMSGKIKGG